MIILREFIISVINKVQLSRITLAANMRSVSILPCDIYPLNYIS